MSSCNALFSRYPIESMIRDRLYRMLAAEIVNKQLKKTEYKFGTRFELEVYVLTPEELSRLVYEYSWQLRMCEPITMPPTA